MKLIASGVAASRAAARASGPDVAAGEAAMTRKPH
jgi:hypothetical protein